MDCSYCGKENSSGDAYCKQCGTPLSVRSATGMQPQRVSPTTETQAVSSRLQNGRYEIRKTLGQGRMGAVFLAVDHRLEEKPVVIKEIIFAYTDPKSLQENTHLLAEEASALALLSHPLIPTVTDHFREGSHYFIVMDYVEGETLEELLSRATQPLEETEVLTYTSEVLDALQYWAQQDPPILHRDLKPVNIIISKEDGRAHLVDFGFAYIRPRVKQKAPQGASGYSPPEQFQGKTYACSDLYTLAAIMHHALTNYDPREHTLFQFLPVRELNPDLSEEIELMLARALTFSPAQRYQSAGDMKRDVDHLLQRHFGLSGYGGNKKPESLTSPHLNTIVLETTSPTLTTIERSLTTHHGQAPVLSQLPVDESELHLPDHSYEEQAQVVSSKPLPPTIQWEIKLPDHSYEEQTQVISSKSLPPTLQWDTQAPIDAPEEEAQVVSSELPTSTIQWEIKLPDHSYEEQTQVISSKPLPPTIQWEILPPEHPSEEQEVPAAEPESQQPVLQWEIQPAASGSEAPAFVSSLTSPVAPVLQPKLISPRTGTLQAQRAGQTTQNDKNRLLTLIISSILLLAIVSAAIFPLFRRATPAPVPLTSGSSASVAQPPAGISVVQAPNGEAIGISDASYVFDTTGPAAQFKEEAAQKLRRGDINGALALLGNAHNQDTSDAEALIYQENLRLHMTNAKYITIVVGTMLTGTANTIAVGHDNLQGAYIAQKEFNDSAQQHGGINLRLLIANSGSDAQYAAQVADQIVQLAHKDPTVIGVAGWALSAQTLAAVTQLSQANIPMVSLAAADNLGNNSQYFFRTGNPASVQAKIGAQYAITTLKAKKVAIFVDSNNDYSRSMTDNFRAGFAGNGRLIVATENYTIGDGATNHDSFAAKLQDALRHRPDLIYFPGYPADASVLLQGLKPSDPPVIGGNALYEINGDTNVSANQLNHLHLTAQAYPDEWDNLKLSAKKPDFFKEYPQAFGPGTPQSPDGFTRATSGAMAAYDATQALLQASELALKNKSPITGTDVRDGLAALTGSRAFQGVTGQISFGSGGDPVNRSVALVCYKGGRFLLDAVIGQFLLNGPILKSYPAKSVCG